MTDVVVVVHHAQLRKTFYCHGHTDRRDIGVAASRITIQDRVQDPMYRSAFWVLGIVFVKSSYPHIKEGAQQLRPGESIRARPGEPQLRKNTLQSST